MQPGLQIWLLTFFLAGSGETLSAFLFRFLVGK